MTAQAPRPLWHGWGEPPHPPHLPDAAMAEIRARVGLPERQTPPVALADVRLAESRLPATSKLHARGALTDREQRVLHAAGKSYPDLVRLRAGDASAAPDAVL